MIAMRYAPARLSSLRPIQTSYIRVPLAGPLQAKLLQLVLQSHQAVQGSKDVFATVGIFQ